MKLKVTYIKTYMPLHPIDFYNDVYLGLIPVPGYITYIHLRIKRDLSIVRLGDVSIDYLIAIS